MPLGLKARVVWYIPSFYVVREFTALLAYKSGRSTQNLASENSFSTPGLDTANPTTIILS